MQAPCFNDQMRSVPSVEAEANSSPSGSNVSDRIAPSCPRSTFADLSVKQTTLTSDSSPAAAMCEPAALKQTCRAGRENRVARPSNLASSFEMSNNATVLSSEALANVLPCRDGVVGNEVRQRQRRAARQGKQKEARRAEAEAGGGGWSEAREAREARERERRMMEEGGGRGGGKRGGEEGDRHERRRGEWEQSRLGNECGAKQLTRICAVCKQRE